MTQGFTAEGKLVVFCQQRIIAFGRIGGRGAGGEVRMECGDMGSRLWQRDSG